MLAITGDRATGQGALLALSLLLALAYGALGPGWRETGVAPELLAALKASGIVVLGLIALLAHSRLLAAGLFFGAAGDALLALSESTFLYGALAFLVGHLFYIALFLRAGLGVGPALREPPRALAALALVIAAVAMTAMIVPGDSPLFLPLTTYTTVLTLMTLTSFSLPAERWLVMVGAVLFFVSDGFVAAHLFHGAHPLVASFWFGFAGWMLYWAGQAALCIGALGLHKRA